MALIVDFDRPANIDITVPLLKEDGDFEDHKLGMSARLITDDEAQGYFKAGATTDVKGVVLEHVKTPPPIMKSEKVAFTLEELVEVPYLRNIMYTRLIEASSDPSGARGN